MLVQQNDRLVTCSVNEGAGSELVVGRPFHSAEFVRQIEKATLTELSDERIAQSLATTPYIVNLVRQRVYVSQILSDPLLRALDESKPLHVKYQIAKKLLRKYQQRLLSAFQNEFPPNCNPIQAVRSILNMSCVNAKTASFSTLLGLMIEGVPDAHLCEFENLFISAVTRKIAYAYMRRYISPSAHCYLLRSARKRVGYRKSSLSLKRSRLRIEVRFIGCGSVFYVALGVEP